MGIKIQNKKRLQYKLGPFSSCVVHLKRFSTQDKSVWVVNMVPIEAPKYNVGFFLKFRYEKWTCNVIHLELWAKTYGQNKIKLWFDSWSLKPHKQSSNDFQIKHVMHH
jgi:hypothetical protein